MNNKKAYNVEYDSNMKLFWFPIRFIIFHNS